LVKEDDTTKLNKPSDLANIYLHYFLELWLKKFRKLLKDNAFIVRYADDFVCCYQ